MNLQQHLQIFQDWLHSMIAWFQNSAATMDLQTSIICGVVFVVSAIVVYLISVFGMKERTYEEAIEEQKRRNKEAIQIAKSDKTKKDKKFKKWNKKGKEKMEDEKVVDVTTSKNVPELMDAKAPVESSPVSSYAAEAKSTVHKRAKQPKSDSTPKGEENIQRQSSSDDTDEQQGLKNSAQDSPQPIDKKEVKVITATAPVEPDDSIVEPGSGDQEVKELLQAVKQNGAEEKAAVLNDVVEAPKPAKKSPAKKARKGKAEIIDSGNEFADIVGNNILAIIKTSGLPEDEIQHVLEVLSSKQKILSSEKKKNDLITSLKKQVQEKDELFKFEQKSCAIANDKAKELLMELAEEKSRFAVTEKSLRDVLNQEQQEIKALHGMMQRKRDQYASEMSSLQSKMQQMKTKLKEEHAVSMQRLQDENNQLQALTRLESEKQQRGNMEVSRLQHEIDQLRLSHEKYEAHQSTMQQTQDDLHHQIQQLEKHIEQLVSSHQEEEYSYKQRINEMSNKLQQAENARSSLVQELQNAQSVCSSLESESSSLRQRVDEANHQINSSEQDIMQLEKRLEDAHKQQNELARCLTDTRNEIMDLTNVKMEQLHTIQTLTQDNESLAAQLSQTMDRLSADGAEEVKQAVESNGKLSNVMEREEHDSIIQEKESLFQHVLRELEQCKCEIMTLSKETECQKLKNNELSEKNRELLETLNVTERNSENKLQEVLKNAERRIEDAQGKADSLTKEMQNILNEQIKEVERALQGRFSKDIENAKIEVENAERRANERIALAEKEIEDRVMKAESLANIRVEEFQESLYRRLNEVNCEAEFKIKEALEERDKMSDEVEDMCEMHKNAFRRMFPKCTVDEKLGFKDWLQQFEKAATLSLKTPVLNDESQEEVLQKLDGILEEKSRLESQVSSYKNVMAETEYMLQHLQSKAESEENRWKTELLSREKALDEVKSDNEKLFEQNKVLESDLKQVKGLKDILTEVEDLRQKLQDVELEKELLQEQLGLNGASGKK